MFERRSPKLLYLYGIDPIHQIEAREQADVGLNAVNEEDRLPRKLFVRRFDLFFFFVAICTYLSDFISDCVVAYLHFTEGRIWYGVCILAPCLLCSFALNLVTIGFLFDDEMRLQHGSRPGGKCRKGFLIKILVCIFQLGPIMYYLIALVEGVRFRREKNAKEARRHFCKMIEAERDATLLRFFEAFLESIPQLLVQGTILAQFLGQKPLDGEIPKWVYIQMVSLIFSLSSACWSVSIQHRSLRFCRPDKVNMHPHESLLQFIWRVSTVLSRFSLLVLSFLAFGFWMVAFFGAHFVVSLLHIAAFQSIEAPFTSIEMGLIGVNAFIHLSTPFNMAEGRTRVQYIIAYFIEALEGIVLATLLYFDQSFDFRWKIEVIMVSGGLFVFGIMVMIFYYSCCHPNRRRKIRIDTDDVDHHPLDSKPLDNRLEEVTPKNNPDVSVPSIPEAIVNPIPR